MNEPSSTFKLVTVWLLVGTCVFLGFQYFERSRLAPRIELSLVGGSRVIELRRGPDGHYHWPGSLNGVEVVFLVDTGATTTALPGQLARRVGLETIGEGRSNTAGGVVDTKLARASLKLDGGIEATNLVVAVIDTLNGQPLLGMDVLGKLVLRQQANMLRIEAPER
jgi:aspartyl protease family protein